MGAVDGEGSGGSIETEAVATPDGATRLVVRLAGEFDFTNAPELRDALLGAVDQAPAAVVVDLSNVTFIDSTSLGAMIAAERRAKASGAAFRLAAPSPSAARLLQLTALNRILPTYSNLSSALYDEKTDHTPAGQPD